jgi:ABC-type sugar transport system substrate-binding protein
VSGGDPTQYWAQGRMTGFMRTIKAAIPDAVFLNTPTTAINTTYDPSTMYSQAKAFILGHPQVQVIENSDIGAEEIDRVISDLGKKGKIFTVGWNVTPGNLSYIDKGIQIGTMDQQWGAQAAFGGTACAEFLAHGKVLPNTQKETAVTQAAVASLLSREGLLSQSTTIARKEINRFLSSH